MKITWYGHAAFAIEGCDESGERRKVILDPYNYPLSGGYLPINEEADVVSVSHDNPRYHSDLRAVLGEPVVFRALECAGGSQVVKGIRIQTCRVFENAMKEGPNAMVKFTLDGITVLHQGDLGHAPTDEALEFHRDVDVLLALAGGPPTIALADLAEAIRKTRPAVVIPMHYKTPKVNLKILPIDRFLSQCQGFEIKRPRSTTCAFNRETLPRRTTVIVLDHAR